ncbi:thioesterase [Arthrobacter sp. MYb211]|uniref:acyl-CoA thioesterase n=1 Tax=Micrococcaceae TaxID=1268 RepID=UPI000CFA96BB|nr:MULTISPECIES: thioesterase family protein [unclassified Arthrobacter]PRA13118.1 thioesterase [Arthrobacter sp. MYb221]PRC10311.1 thioesterase [Arthrobacter sp. MYb211]
MTGAPEVVAAEVSEFLGAALAGSSLERTVEWVDTDAAGHQHNSVIMRFVEAAESKLFRELGLKGYFPISPRVRQEIDFKSKLYFGQSATAAIRIDRLGTSSMHFAFRVWGHPFEGNGLAVAAEGKVITVCVPEGSSGSGPWPAEIRQTIVDAQASGGRQ